MIDVSVLVGAAPRLTPAVAYSLEATVNVLSSHAVRSALVATRTGVSYRVRAANDLALSYAGVHNGVRLHPVATLNPVEYLDWPAELERVLAAGAVALRFFPDQQSWSVRSEAFAAIVGALNGRCPVLMPVGRYGDATEIGAATEALDAPVVLVGGHYTQLGDCLAALRRWPHLLLETSCLGQFGGVETVVRQVGAERLLFGSGAPARPVQAPLNAVLSADLSHDERHAILAGNAVRAFGLPLERFDLPAPTVAQDLVDVHTHTGSLAFPTPEVEPRQHAATLARHGIVRSVASSLRAITDDVEVGNREAFDAVSGQVGAYVVLNPNDLEASCEAMDDAYSREVAVGAKLHCGWSHQPTASRACADLLRAVARRGRPLLIHVDGPDWPDPLYEVACAFPSWKVIVAHAGPGTPVLESACLVERTLNVYVELATSFPDRWIAREVVRRVGPGRLLFGSDAPLLEPAYVQGIYADSAADFVATASAAREAFDL